MKKNEGQGDKKEKSKKTEGLGDTDENDQNQDYKSFISFPSRSFPYFQRIKFLLKIEAFRILTVTT